MWCYETGIWWVPCSLHKTEAQHLEFNRKLVGWLTLCEATDSLDKKFSTSTQGYENNVTVVGQYNPSAILLEKHLAVSELVILLDWSCLEYILDCVHGSIACLVQHLWYTY